MFYKLRNVISFNFNIIQDLYELVYLTQLEKNYYKRIDDVKSRKRLNVIIIAKIEIETKMIINKTINIIMISTSINEKIEQISIEMTIWNFNQFCTSIFRIIKTFNLDSTKKKLMKTNKCFNYDESKHLNRDYLKLKKFRIVKVDS
jgi:hypothetical protein